jgi:hypothetical protein
MMSRIASGRMDRIGYRVVNGYENLSLIDYVHGGIE